MIRTKISRGHSAFKLELSCPELPDILELRKMMLSARDTADTPAGSLFFDSLVKQLERCLPVSDHLNEAESIPGENESPEQYRERMSEKLRQASVGNDRGKGVVLHEQVSETIPLVDDTVTADDKQAECCGDCSGECKSPAEPPPKE